MPAAGSAPGQVLAIVDRSVQAQQAAQLAAQIEAARADAALAQNNYERAVALQGRGFVSKADIDSQEGGARRRLRSGPRRPGPARRDPRPDRPARRRRADRAA